MCRAMASFNDTLANERREMTIGVDGSTAQAELERLESVRGDAVAITDDERRERIATAQRLMREQGIDALYLDATTSLYYFTGQRFWASERLHGAIIPAEGHIAYLSPAFEEAKTRVGLRIGDDIRVWEEHEDPSALVIDTVRSMGHSRGTIAVDELTPFFTFDGLRRAGLVRLR